MKRFMRVSVISFQILVTVALFHEHLNQTAAAARDVRCSVSVMPEEYIEPDASKDGGDC